MHLKSRIMFKIIKDWTLPIAMLTGVASYFVYASIPFLNGTHQTAMRLIAVVQPLLLFTMLFLTFCKVRPHDLHRAKWQPWLLVTQCIAFLACVLTLWLMPNGPWRIVIESAMLCLICPTATSAAVVTRKLGGNAGTLMAYTIAINLAVSLLVPAVVPIIHPNPDQTFLTSFLIIISKVFPLLLGPLLLSIAMRRIAPRTVEWLAQKRDLPFYIWSVCLALAIAVSTRSIVHTTCPWPYQVAIAVASLITCIAQFMLGRRIGQKYHDPISAAQACGQKNTVLIIWMGYTFMTPVTSIAGGFYSIWHNLYNSWQMYQKRIEEEKWTRTS